MRSRVFFYVRLYLFGEFSTATNVLATLPDRFNLETVGELIASSLECGCASLAHGLSIPINLHFLLELHLAQNSTWVTGNTFEDVDAKTISAEAGIAPEEGRLFADLQAADIEDVEQDSGGRASGSQALDTGMSQADVSDGSPQHEDSGGDPNRFHSSDADVSFPHGDVVPQTPQSEAGCEILDDIPFGRMMSPQRVFKQEPGRPGSVNLVGHVFKFEHLDIDAIIRREWNLDGDPYESVGDLTARAKELRFPYSPQQPELSDCLLMVQVDDLLIVGTREVVVEELIPSLQLTYTPSIGVMSMPGDEVPFLKGAHRLLDDGRPVIKIHHKHLDQLCKLLCLSKRLQNKKSRRHSEIETLDSTGELSAHEASICRSCIRILLFLSSDLPQCQYVIGYLPTRASKPTEKAMTVLKRLDTWQGMQNNVFP
eukprot:s1130_g32.t1